MSYLYCAMLISYVQLLLLIFETRLDVVNSQTTCRTDSILRTKQTAINFTESSDCPICESYRFTPAFSN